MRKLFLIVVVFAAGVAIGRLWEVSVVESAPPKIAAENGDANGDGVRDVSDAIHLLGWLFLGGPEPAPIASCPPRFLDNGDGTITDTETGRIWLRRTVDVNEDGVRDQLDRVTKAAAAELEADFEFAGRRDWSLPTTRELTSLVDLTRESGHDPVFELQSGLYWIGSTNAGDPCHGCNFALHFGEDRISPGFMEVHGDFDWSSTAHVLLVRRP